MNKQTAIHLVRTLPMVVSLALPTATLPALTQPAVAQTAPAVSTSSPTPQPLTSQNGSPQSASFQSSPFQPSNPCGQTPCSSSGMMSQSAGITIPQSTAIVVSFPATIAVDVGDEDEPYPLTLPLAQAILDNQGNVLIPENTPVSILVQPTDHGAKITAQSLVVNGHIVPIQASSPVIPSATITQRRANDRAVENGAVFGRLVGSGFGFVNNGDPDQFDRGAMLGSAVGMLMGLRSSQHTHVVQISQGSVFVLALEAPIQLSF